MQIMTIILEIVADQIIKNELKEFRFVPMLENREGGKEK